ncbi:MAG TPA: site-2 protease family protein, partial [Polyangiaceae bacterium]|nr:site-2 protease family protein [Polyangiaceae bacterium]
MQWSTKLFRIRGIDVRVHATFALIVALGATQWGARHGMGGAAFGAAFTLALFACVLLHELGHSLVAQKFGLQVKEIILLPIGGIANLLGKPKHPGQEIAIALAGPAVNILLAGLFGAALWATGQHLGGARALVASAKLPSLSTFLLLLTTGNLSLALFNLLPVFPLDGGRVLRALLELRWGAVRATVWAAGFGQVAALALGGYAVWSGQLFLAFIAAMIFMSAARETASTQLHGPLTQLRAEQLAEMPAVEFDAHDRIRDAVPSLLRSAQTAFPVVSGSEVAGVVLRQDLIRAAEQPET